MSTAYLGLGSNLNNPVQQILTAINELNESEHITVIKQSKLYRSKAQGYTEQDDFINAVVQIQTELSASALLASCQAIEQIHHRQRVIRWGPRTLDIDILLFDELTIHDETLTLPHPRMLDRDFVIYPLLEITPKLQLPCNTPLSHYTQHINDSQLNLISIEKKEEHFA